CARAPYYDYDWYFDVW
nr:immunoglobulin heavy chain junction region [Mus musculus]MBK4184355.1 immunoglobulin heavy chain junction region [Mus musculus]